MSAQLTRATHSRVARPAPESGFVDTGHGHVDVAAVSGWSPFGFADEDLDPTPVPTGCPQCWKTGGGRCQRCPAR